MLSRQKLIEYARDLHAAHLRVRSARADSYAAAYGAARAELIARKIKPTRDFVRSFVTAAMQSETPRWDWHTSAVTGFRQKVFYGPLLFHGRALTLICNQSFGPTPRLP